MKRFYYGLLGIILGIIGLLVSQVTFAQGGDSCTLTWGGTLYDGQSISGWKIPEATKDTSCDEAGGTLICNNGDLLGGKDIYTYSNCITPVPGQCVNPWTGRPMTNGTQIVGYSSNTSSSTVSCNDLIVRLTCDNGTWQGGNVSSTYSGCNDLGIKDCAEAGYPHGWSQIYYSNLTSIYPEKCVDIGSEFSCTNGVFIGDANQYPYDNCLDGLPADCNIGGTIIPHSGTITAYSAQEVLFPKTCEQVSTNLTCNNGSIIGNRNTFKYLGCQITGGLVDGVDLRLEVNFPAGNIGLAQYSSPAIDIVIKNRGIEIVNKNNVEVGFLTCYWNMDDGQKLIIYQSKELLKFTLNPGTFIKQTILLKDIFTQSLGDKKISCQLKKWDNETIIANNSRTGTASIIKAERFDIAMNRSIDSIRGNLDAPEILSDVSATPGADAIKDFLIKKIMDILVPLIITLGILIAILGFYKILFSSDGKNISQGVNYILYGVIGIIVIMSAKYISTTLYSNIFQEGVLGYGAVQGYEIAQKIYEKIAFPFIKLAIYLALGVLFVILASRALTFIFGSDDDTKKKAGTIIAWNVVGMLVIIGAKQVIEFIYGKQQDVVKSVSNLGEVGSGILANKNLPILYEIINWAMGLAALVILIMVLVQAFQLLLKPDSPDAMKKIKNSLMYIFIGILVIGTGYIITNFLIIN